MAKLSGNYILPNGTNYKGKLLFQPVGLINVYGESIVTQDAFNVSTDADGLFSHDSISAGSYEVKTATGNKITIRVLDDSGDYTLADCIVSTVSKSPTNRYVTIGYLYNPTQGGYQALELSGDQGHEHLSFGAVESTAPAGLIIDRLLNTTQGVYQLLRLEGVAGYERIAIYNL